MYRATYESSNAVPAVVKAPKRVAIATADGDDKADYMTIGKGGKALNLTSEGVFRTLRDIFEQRGRKVRNADQCEYAYVSRTPIVPRPSVFFPSSSRFPPALTSGFEFCLLWYQPVSTTLRTLFRSLTTLGYHACANSTA